MEGKLFIGVEDTGARWGAVDPQPPLDWRPPRTSAARRSCRSPDRRAGSAGSEQDSRSVTLRSGGAAASPSPSERGARVRRTGRLLIMRAVLAVIISGRSDGEGDGDLAADPSPTADPGPDPEAEPEPEPEPEAEPSATARSATSRSFPPTRSDRCSRASKRRHLTSSESGSPAPPTLPIRASWQRQALTATLRPTAPTGQTGARQLTTRPSSL